MPSNYSRNTYDRHPNKINRIHLCPFSGDYVMPFVDGRGAQHLGHCPKCGTVTYVSMPETVTHKFTSFIRAELAAEEHKALKIALDVTAPAWQVEAEAQAADANDWNIQVTELRNG